MERPKEVSRKFSALELTKLLHVDAMDTSLGKVPGVQKAPRSKLDTESRN